MTNRDRILRLDAIVNRRTGCILWTGGATKAGYGAAYNGSRQELAHRQTYSLYHGKDGQVVRHVCDVRRCINIDHLLDGTHGDNVRDAIERGRAKYARGDGVGASKLTECEVMDMRAEFAAGATRKELASKYGVSVGHTGKIVDGTMWKHIAL